MDGQEPAVQVLVERVEMGDAEMEPGAPAEDRHDVEPERNHASMGVRPF